MNRWIILPYDASPLARAALARAAQAVCRPGVDAHSTGVLLATAGVDPLALGALVRDAQVIAGPDVPLEVRLLNPGDPIGDLEQLAGSLPDAVLAAPLGGAGNASWYADACMHGGRGHGMMLFFISPGEIKRFEEDGRERRGVGGGLGTVFRGGARLRLGLRALVGGGMR